MNEKIPPLQSGLEKRVDALQGFLRSLADTVSMLSERIDSIQNHSLQTAQEVATVAKTLNSIEAIVERAADRFAKVVEQQQIESVPLSIQIGAVHGN